MSLLSMFNSRSAPSTEKGPDFPIEWLDPQASVVNISFTTRCTLRCTYCAVSQPDYHGEDIDLSNFDKLIEDMKNLGVRYVNLNGHGETTMIEEWDSYARRLLDAGFLGTLTSNFGRYFSEEEIDLLSRLAQIIISIDSTDRERLREVRRNVDVRTILTNMVRVRARARVKGIPQPRITWNSVLNDRVAQDVLEWTATGIQLGVDSFMLGNLIKYPDLDDGGVNVRHPSTLPKDQIAQLITDIEKAQALAEQSGLGFRVQEGLLDSLKAALDEKRHNQPIAHKDGNVEKRSILPDEGMTRDCLDPWYWSVVQVNGGVQLCCAAYRPVGYLKEGTSLANLLNGEEARKLREELLTGNLSHGCKVCPLRGSTTPEALRQKVESLRNGQEAWTLVEVG